MRNSLFIGLILTLFACNSNTQIQAKKTVQPTITAKANKTIELEIEGRLFYDDAASYEQHLEQVIQKFSYFEKQEV
jgi:hypothetical protein